MCNNGGSFYEHGDTKTKKELQRLLELALELTKTGDTIITLEVSHLSRSTQQLCELIEIIHKGKRKVPTLSK